MKPYVTDERLLFVEFFLQCREDSVDGSKHLSTIENILIPEERSLKKMRSIIFRHDESTGCNISYKVDQKTWSCEMD